MLVMQRLHDMFVDMQRSVAIIRLKAQLVQIPLGILQHLAPKPRALGKTQASNMQRGCIPQFIG